MMAVTGTLKNGVLKIDGTKYADTVNFNQSNGIITVSGVAGSWSAAQVTSIVINLGKGNDVLSFDSLANGGAEALAENITVTAAKKENDLVHLANGHDVSLIGPIKHTLTVSSTGTATLNGQVLSWDNPTPPDPTPPDPNPPAPTPNWFDSHVIDTALRSLGHDLYTDGRIDRNDMVSLLRNVEDGGIIDSTELTDLRAIVANTSLFGTSDYIWTLSGYIVSGNTANAHFQGQTMGNLVAGAASSQMENLIGKWFFGLDRPQAGGTYRQVSGTLFVNGASYTDIHQGALGDCYFMSSLAETALKDPSTITNMFVVNGDGTYTVRFFNNGQAQYVTVDSYLPTSGSGLMYADYGATYNNPNNELWTALAEKAYVQINEMGWLRSGLSGNGQNSYSAIEGGYIYAALGQITGQGTSPFTFTAGASSFSTFVNAFNQGELIGFASKSTPASSQVVGNHAYAVVGYNAANQTVTLFNPWGIEYGLVTMTWSQIQGSFSYFDRTV